MAFALDDRHFDTAQQLVWSERCKLYSPASCEQILGALQAALSSTGHSPGMGRRRQAMPTSSPTLACPASCGSTTLTMALADASNTWWKSGAYACLQPLHSCIQLQGAPTSALETSATCTSQVATVVEQMLLCSLHLMALLVRSTLVWFLSRAGNAMFLFLQFTTGLTQEAPTYNYLLECLVHSTTTWCEMPFAAGSGMALTAGVAWRSSLLRKISMWQSLITS